MLHSVRRPIRIAVFVALAGGVYLGLVALSVIAAGEVSCYEVCSPTSEFLNDAAPWPAIAAVVVSLAVGAVLARPGRS